MESELQTQVDLVVTRMRRLLGLTPESNHWRPWIDGYTEVRADLESGEAAAQGLEAACPDPLR